jgi:N-acetylglucosamine kinase-like BadF-type ATPase
MESLVNLPRELLVGSSTPSAGDLVVGVDGGGTKTLAAVWDPAGNKVSTGVGGPSNPDSTDDAEATEAVHDAVMEALAGREPDTIAAAVFAIAGTDTEGIADSIGKRFHYTNAFTVNDVVAAWAAATDCKPGVAVIAGTGSNVLGVGKDGATWRAGGWGHILGDEGSGHWLGLQGMKAAIRVREATGPATPLAEDAPEHFGTATVEEMVALTYSKPLNKSEIASFSRRVAERAAEGDPVSVDIVETAGRELATFANAAIAQTGLDDGDPFVVGKVGSTWKAGPLLQSAFADTVRKRTPAAEFKLVTAPPVYGALLLAGRAANLWSDEAPPELFGLLERADLP